MILAMATTNQQHASKLRENSVLQWEAVDLQPPSSCKVGEGGQLAASGGLACMFFFWRVLCLGAGSNLSALTREWERSCRLMEILVQRAHRCRFVPYLTPMHAFDDGDAVIASHPQ
jgi:hypothetical protein